MAESGNTAQVLDLLETAILGRHQAEERCLRADNEVIALVDEVQRLSIENEELYGKLETKKDQCTQVEKKATEAQRAFLDAMNTVNKACNILNELVGTHPKCEACHDPAIAHVIPCNHLTCGRGCLNNVCENCGMSAAFGTCDEHALPMGCGVRGCTSTVEGIRQVTLSSAQGVLHERVEDIKDIATFKTAAATLVEKWEGEVVSDDESSEIEELLLA